MEHARGELPLVVIEDEDEDADHHQRELSARMLHREHDEPGASVATLHLHLDRHNCLEAKVIRGTPDDVRSIADELIALKGVKFGRLIPATAGRNIT
ncbi:MAG TPA: hypothetical protein ENO23_03975 [Alphaproteobacteria bacterium]|nr:hypothetical protein [Alphaproteobacteria bacterium]